MIAYHLKRVFRNRLCLHAPAFYARHIGRVVAQVPPLAEAAVSGRGSIDSDLVGFVSGFYHDEYISHIDDVASGAFSFFGQSVDFGSVGGIDWHHELAVEKDLHLWRMKLAHMGFIGPMLVSGAEVHLKAVEEIISGFPAKARFDVPGCFSSYWFPYSASHRVLNILSGYLIARRNREIPVSLQRKVEDFLRLNVGFILANIEHELKNNHVERNLAAICLYYGHVEVVPTGIARRIDRDVREIISSCVLEDGMLAERSAMYQGLTVMALQIFAATDFLSEDTRCLAATRLPLAERAWALMTHPDGEIGLFNDSWFGEVPMAAGVLPPMHFDSVTRLPAAGYARLQSGDFFALFDAGAIGPCWNPGHGHADFLSAEMDVAGTRFIVDPGTFQYSTGPRRHFERSAQSHNGPTCEGMEPVSYSGCFKVGRMVEARLLEGTTTSDADSVAGELKLPNLAVRREISLSRPAIRCADRWDGAVAGAVVRLLVQGEWGLTAWDTNQATFDRGRLRARIVVRQGFIEQVEPGQWAKQYLRSDSAWTLTLRPASSGSSRADLVWDVLRD